MGAEKINIEQFLELAKDYPVLDVRSPGEYNHAHIPGACSLPLFSDEERKVVGTTYKQQSREAAIKIGLDYFGPKMRKMVEEVESIIKSREPGTMTKDSRLVLVHCWRGGMRSGAVSWLLDMYGFKVFTLTG
ncbi:MAG TPA: rhodanese-like domain-containing protein, partial [Chitinophagaceae bacterium]|nr:rhodanese-like domain-containing protein [Chitinophagaceae bacterium]